MILIGAKGVLFNWEHYMMYPLKSDTEERFNLYVTRTTRKDGEVLAQKLTIGEIVAVQEHIIGCSFDEERSVHIPNFIKQLRQPAPDIEDEAEVFPQAEEEE